jgi:superfamily II DNA/RNA helicase
MFIKKAEPVVVQDYVPVNRFQDFLICDELQNSITARGYLSPTPIQDKVIPEVLKGRDVVGIAQTGTGKTAAFLIPLIQKTLDIPSTKTLIVTPTRELAVQIEDELKSFTKSLNIRSALCIGGASINTQTNLLKRNPQFVVGTPGRLKDLSERKTLAFSSFNTIVLDEVDRMLDMGFVREVDRIIAQLPRQRHSLFFSATLPTTVRTVMDRLLFEPLVFTVKAQVAPEQIDQDVVRINGRQKIEVLHELLIQKAFEKVLVFGRTKWGMEKLAKELDYRGFKVAAIHGNKSQSQRQRALDLFKANHVQVLIATDIASRGLDIENVTHVINYDLPETYDDYIHRIGRTGRANRTGTALTFID